jgi:hypothetical protein
VQSSADYARERFSITYGGRNKRKMLNEILTWLGVAGVSIVTFGLYVAATRDQAEEAPEPVNTTDPGPPANH